jgi:hypothetical protein
MKDLVVVVPDSNTEQTLYGLLERHKALQIRRIEYRILVHPERDPGVLQRGASLLAEIDALNAFRYALLIFDREGCGREMLTSSELEQQVQQQLDASGWQGRSAVVVIDPELESWVFATSPHVVDVFAGGRRRSVSRSRRKLSQDASRKASEAKGSRKETTSPESNRPFVGTLQRVSQ